VVIWIWTKLTGSKMDFIIGHACNIKTKVVQYSLGLFHGLKNRLVFMKTDKPVRSSFTGFWKIGPSNMKFEIKMLKKLESISRFLVKAEFKNSK
jgi:hypothetical protein